MRFEWDEAKRQANIRKHRVDFRDIVDVFSGPLYVRADLRRGYGEERWIGIGERNGYVFYIVFTEPNEDTIRLVSARKADRDEQHLFEKEIWKNRY